MRTVAAKATGAGATVILATLLVSLPTAPGARAATPAPAPPPVTLDATGDTPLGLKGVGAVFAFGPPQVVATVGQTLRWTNRSARAAHTVTEAHGFFDLRGNGVGGTAGEPRGGFGPGTTAELAAAAGSFTYHCQLHPEMVGTFAVPVTLSLGPRYHPPRVRPKTRLGRLLEASRKRDFQRRLRLTWAPATPPEGLAYDVEVKRGRGIWKPLLTRTLDRTLTINSGKAGSFTQVRARMRLEADQTMATDWSPPATARP